jgi:hypothetical protein
MAHIGMAANAVDVSAAMRRTEAYVRDEILMAAQAVFLQLYGIHGTDANGVGKVLQGELHRVIPAIVRLGDEFGDERMWGVAIVADGPAMVAGLLPGIELFLHDVAVGALLGVVAEVGEAFGELKGVGSQTQGDTKQGANDGRQSFHEHGECNKSL